MHPIDECTPRRSVYFTRANFRRRYGENGVKNVHKVRKCRIYAATCFPISHSYPYNNIILIS